ncbi:MAG: aspartate-alanine antiporter [Phycisphaerales bacterium]|nr:aspartate-alanine antiporter [Phycisphaerales bacterium]
MAWMLEQLGDLLRRFPEIAVFLTLGLGYLLGRIKFKGFGLGTVVGTLVVGMVIGQAHVEVPNFARTLFFLLFMFATGYHVGPQFFVSLRRGGMQLVILSLIFAIVGIGMTILIAWFLKLDSGFTGGLLSGALTQSSVIGTASDAIQQLQIPDDQKAVLVSHVPVADAVTYLYGTIGVTLLLTKVFPAIMRINLRAECEKFEEELGASLDKPEDQAGFEAAISIDVQAFKVGDEFAEKTVAEAEAAAESGVQVARWRRRGRAVRPDKRLPLRKGDIIALSGPREALLKIGPRIGEQVVDAAAMEVPFHSRTIIITNRKAVGTALSQVRQLDDKRGQGLHLRRLTRQGEPLPLLPRTILQRGDAAELIGTAEDLDRVTPLLGVPDVPTEKTNFVAMGLTIALGALLGVFAIRIGGIPVGMGTGGGVLLAGLAFGWLGSYQPALGRIPDASVWLMQNLGLNAFVAMVGLAAGPHAVEAMKSSGVQLLLASIVVATVPHAIAFTIGRYIFKLNAGQLMGALAGAGTVTAGLQALVDESDSSVPVLGYTVPYAINNILLTASGPVVVAASQFWAQSGP